MLIFCTLYLHKGNRLIITVFQSKSVNLPVQDFELRKKAWKKILRFFHLNFLKVLIYEK